MNNQPALDFETSPDLLEARAIIADLSARFDALKIQDQRFVSSWRLYLTRTGAAARVGEARLYFLRRVHGVYFQTVEQAA